MISLKYYHCLVLFLYLQDINYSGCVISCRDKRWTHNEETKASEHEICLQKVFTVCLGAFELLFSPPIVTVTFDFCVIGN